MSPTSLPTTSSSSRSSSPVLASSGFGGVLHPVAFDSSSGFNSAVSGVVHPVIVAGWSSGAVVTKASIVLDSVLGGIGGAAADCMTLCQVLVNLPMLSYMAALTVAALVASDLGVVSGLRAITREVTELRAVVACDVCGRTRFGALTRDVSFSLAIVASNDRFLGAVGLVVTIQNVN